MNLNGNFIGDDNFSVFFGPRLFPNSEGKKKEDIKEDIKNEETNAHTLKKQGNLKNKENSEGKENDKKSLNNETMINNDKIKGEKVDINIPIKISGLFTKEDIIDILSKNKLDTFKKIIENSDISTENLELKHLNKKRRRKGKLKKPNKNDEIKGEPNRRGRKKKDDKIKGSHNRSSTDNIIRKVKKNLKDYVVSSNKEHLGNELKTLNYNELVSKGDKKANLELLDMPLKEFLSQDISGKYTTEDSDTNRKYINKILEEKKNDEKIKYILNITFRDWIEIFTMKRKSSVEFKGIDKLLEKILNDKDNKDDNNYFCNFVFCLYNYEKYWESKRDRKSNKTA